MPGTITVREFLWRVSTVLDDRNPQFNRWPERELVDATNDGCLSITKFLPAACSRVDAIKLKQGTTQSIDTIAAVDCKPGDGSTPTQAILGVQMLDWVCNMGADGLTPGQAIPQPVARRILDQERPNWHTVTGTTVQQVAFDPATPRTFYVQPAVPATPAVWLRVAYIAQPLRIPNTGSPGSELYAFSGTNTAVLPIGDENVEELLYYVVARAYMKNAEYGADTDRMTRFANLFTSSLNARVAAITGHNPNLTRLPLAPEPIGAAR